MGDESISRELFNARFDALEAKMALWVASLEKENIRQDEAIERIADRSTHYAETQRLTERVQKLEEQSDSDRGKIGSLDYKVKVLWTTGTLIVSGLTALLIAIIKGWIGV